MIRDWPRGFEPAFVAIHPRCLWVGVRTLILIALSSTSKIVSARERPTSDTGCSTEASIWLSTADAVGGLSAVDAWMNETGVMSEFGLRAAPSGRMSKYEGSV